MRTISSFYSINKEHVQHKTYTERYSILGGHSILKYNILKGRPAPQRQQAESVAVTLSSSCYRQNLKDFQNHGICTTFSQLINISSLLPAKKSKSDWKKLKFVKYDAAIYFAFRRTYLFRRLTQAHRRERMMISEQ